MSVFIELQDVRALQAGDGTPVAFAAVNLDHVSMVLHQNGEATVTLIMKEGSAFEGVPAWGVYATDADEVREQIYGLFWFLRTGERGAR